MTLTNVHKKQNPHKCEGFAVVVTETNKLQLYFYGQKYATIKANASAIDVSVGTTSSKPHIIGAPVYTTHCASRTSEQGSGVGQPKEVGHGAGDIRPVSAHPHFLHPQSVQVILFIV